MPTQTTTRTIHKLESRRITALSRLIHQTLERCLPKAAQSPQVVHEAMRYCVFSGGRRFRPLLTLGACRAVGANPRQALLAACAIECIHTYSLVHDDLPAMDNADQRRGMPTCHRKFGEGNAILVGDALLTLGFDLLSRDGTPNSLAIIQNLGQTCGTGGLIGGQVLDLQVISHSHTAAERLLREIAERKTASLITASVISGALAGNATAGQLRPLERFGQDLGLAFQLIDDVHDEEGLATAMGMAEAQAEAHRLIERAVKRLDQFGRRADVLRELAAWLVETS